MVALGASLAPPLGPMCAWRVAIATVESAEKLSTTTSSIVG